MSLKHTSIKPISLRAATRLPLAAVALGAALALTACGGGGNGIVNDANSAANPQPSTLTYTQGTVEGLGSVVVNGVRFDESTARITDDAERSISPAEMKLGMRVEVLALPAQASADGASRATAQTVRYSSELQGPISALLPEGFVVLGHSVRYGARTLFEAGRSATLRVGQMVEVHGLRDAQGVVQASLIEIEGDRDERNKVIGTVTAVDTAQRTIWVDGVQISYANVAAATELAVGQRVRVELASATATANAWNASKLRVLQPLDLIHVGTHNTGAQGVEVDMEGVITRVDSASRFFVAGVRVDASQVRTLPSALVVGDAVEVEGRLTEGTILARQIERERYLDADDEGFDVEGDVTAVDMTAQTLVLRGIFVDWRNARFEDGTAQQLGVGRRLDVKGNLSADGRTLVATEIEFD